MQADRKERRQFTFSKTILPKIQPKQRGITEYVKKWIYYRIQNQRGGGGKPTKAAETDTWENIKKLFALLYYPACGFLSPTWTPGKRVVLQLFPDFEEMDNLRSSAAAGVSKTMLIGEPNCFKQSCLQTGRAQLMELVCS